MVIEERLHTRLMEKIDECRELKSELSALRQQITDMEEPFRSPVRPVQWEGHAAILASHPKGQMDELRIVTKVSKAYLHHERPSAVKEMAQEKMSHHILQELVDEGWIEFSEGGDPVEKYYTARIVVGRYMQ